MRLVEFARPWLVKGADEQAGRHQFCEFARRDTTIRGFLQGPLVSNKVKIGQSGHEADSGGSDLARVEYVYIYIYIYCRYTIICVYTCSAFRKFKPCQTSKLTQILSLRCRAGGGNHRIVQLLLSFNADVERCGPNRPTPIFIAAHFGHCHVVPGAEGTSPEIALRILTTTGREGPRVHLMSSHGQYSCR